jgi:hypothetical protein
MGDHTIDICNDWNGNKGDKVTFVNGTDKNCVITQEGASPWPFKDGPPIPTTGSIPPGGSATTHLKKSLADGTYPYDVDCCKSQVPKNVTVP